MPSSGGQKCARSEEHTSELQSHDNLVCRLLLEKTTTQKLTATETTGPRPPPPHHTGSDSPKRAAGTPSLVSNPNADDDADSDDAIFFLNDPAATKVYFETDHKLTPV